MALHSQKTVKIFIFIIFLTVVDFSYSHNNTHNMTSHSNSRSLASSNNERIIAKESRHFTLDLLNHHSESFVRTNTLQTSQLTENYITQEAARENLQTLTSSEQLLVVAENSQGNRLSETIINNPLVTKVEIFDEATGSIQYQDLIEHERGLASITLPQSEEIAVLKVFTLRKGKIIEIERITVEAPRQDHDVAFAVHTQSDQVKQVMYNGDPSNRSDLVLVAEGYTQRELPKFANDVERIMEGYFNERPYRQYRNFFNVWRVDVASNSSGAGTNDRRIDTAFGARFGCSGIQRLLCVDQRTVERYVRDRMPANQVDQILVVVNTTTYGGAGGRIATMSLAPAAVDLALHEVGHSYAGLADEYDYGNCNLREPRQPNVTTNFGTKWDHWVGVDNVGWYEGANYCAEGMYRPTNNSMMRTLGRPFQAVNNELLILKTYEYVDPIESPTPNVRELTVNNRQTFSINTVNPIPNTLATTWFVNSQQVGSGNSFTLNAADYSQGNYQVRVRVEDTTGMVRKDDNNLTRDSFVWQVNINNDSPCTPASPSTQPTISNIASTSFTANWDNISNAQHYLVQTWDGSVWQDYATTENNSLSLTGFPQASTQYVRVIVTNACNQQSEPSPWIEVQLNDDSCQAPGRPTQPTISNITSSTFTARWNEADNTSSYQTQLWINNTWVDYEIATTNSLQVTGISQEIAYVRAIAINACGVLGTPSAWTEVVMNSGCESAPSRPDNLSISGNQLSWTPSTGATRYLIYRWTGSEWVSYSSSISASLNLNAQTPRYLSIRAENDCGTSSLSSWIDTQ